MFIRPISIQYEGEDPPCRNHTSTMSPKPPGALTGEWQGWELPLSYGNPEEEYSSATTSAAVYDASGIGRLKVTGADGLDLLHRLSTNAVGKPDPRTGGPTQSSPTTVDA